MSKPKFFRDPIHLQLRFEDVPLDSDPRGLEPRLRRSWILRKLIDDPLFQRLRSIRQNGLTNFVFHGAEHSRFTHSLGVCHLAGTMYEKIVRNCSENLDEEVQTVLMAAALLHDIGHGPFSHALEEIVREVDPEFKHEKMTIEFLKNGESSISTILREVDDKLPEVVEAFFDKSKRKDNSWTYKVVSSQIDADRLDYLMRDQLFSGIRGTGFDIERILDLMYHHEGSIAVEIGALEAVEAYLFTLDHMYRAMYYHHAVRAATVGLGSAMRRAIQLYRAGDKGVFPRIEEAVENPLETLINMGGETPVSRYSQLNEHLMWQHLEFWRQHKDPLLADLSDRVVNRRLFKTLEVRENRHKDIEARIAYAKEAALKIVPGLDKDTVGLYVVFDEPERTSYRTYTWAPESAEESIWLVGSDIQAHPIEMDEDSRIIEGLKKARFFSPAGGPC